MPAAPRNGQPWPLDETQRLREMAATGMTAAEIAEGLGRTVLGIKVKRTAIGASIKPRARPRSFPVKLCYGICPSMGLQ